MPRRLGFLLLLLFSVAPLVFAQHAGPHVAAPRGYAPPTSRAPLPAYRPRASAVAPFRAGAAFYRPWPIYPYPRRFPVGPNSFVIQPFWYLWSGWGYNSCWWTNCYLNWNLGYGNTLPFFTYAPAYVPLQNYIYYGDLRSDLPQLFLKDGTVYSVSDYWVADNQLHFIASDPAGRQPAEQVIPLDDLDLQTTIDVNTRRGFRFVLRNEPIDQYLRDHPNEPPPPWTAPAANRQPPESN